MYVCVHTDTYIPFLSCGFVVYFEAVSEALAKLADPNVKGSTKSSMQKQLKVCI